MLAWIVVVLLCPCLAPSRCLVPIVMHLVLARGPDQGLVRLEDKLGNAGGGYGCQAGSTQSSKNRYPIMLQLHRYMVAVSRVAVDRDGRGWPPLATLPSPAWRP